MTTKPKPTLYLIMRNDMASLNPGKAMAQAHHAGTHMILSCWSPWHDLPAEEIRQLESLKTSIKKWSGDCGFGRTITLSADYDTIGNIEEELIGNYYGIYPYLSDWIIDPSYPLKDGEFIHKIEVYTCWYVFDDGSIPDLKERIGLHRLPLYN